MKYLFGRSREQDKQDNNNHRIPRLETDTQNKL